MQCENIDVLVVGAGVSGVGAGCHLTMKCPDRSFVILEGRDTIGGTWDLFRYPGIRSDSNMFTFGYAFRPWTANQCLVDGESIRRYVEDTARAYGVDKKIRFHHRVIRADWSSRERRWTVDVKRLDTGETFQMKARFLLTCTGYYNYEHGHRPEFKGIGDFQGVIAHPQHWPEDLDYTGKNVLIIGSGATAVTLVPAMARDAGHVTMLQRSPTYILSVPSEDAIAAKLRRYLPEMAAYRLTRAKSILVGIGLFSYSKRWPDRMRRYIRKVNKDLLGPDVDVDAHFKPKYGPWDQRLCVAKDSDFFEVLKDGSATIVTDHIDCFTESGVKLVSGQEISADIIVLATGLEIQFLGGAELCKDGERVDPSTLITYRGMMFSGLPNFVSVIGYTNATWTLKVDLTCGYVCRLLGYLEKRGFDTVTPSLERRPAKTEPMFNLNSGYLMRAAHRVPQQGSDPPWRSHHNYIADLLSVRFGRLEDGVLSFQ